MTQRVCSAVFGIHISRICASCGAEPWRQRDLALPVLLGIRRELSAELFISEHSFSPRRKIEHALGTLLFVCSWNASGPDKSFENLYFGCVQFSGAEALRCFLGSSCKCSYSQSLVFLLHPCVVPGIIIFSQIRPAETCWSPYNNLFISFCHLKMSTDTAFHCLQSEAINQVHCHTHKSSWFCHCLAFNSTQTGYYFWF